MSGLSDPIFEFKPKHFPLLTQKEIMRILKEGKFNPDLGYTDLEVKAHVLNHDGETHSGEEIPVNRRELEVALSRGKREDVYVLKNGKLFKLSFFKNGRYYRLLDTGEAPTIEISGIRMHRTKGIGPWKDSERKTLSLRPGKKHLDICTGLGYTAINALRFGSQEVITIEKDETILEIAELNPWSRGLSSERIKIKLGDATELIRDLEDSSFDSVLLDPPRMALAGELYSREFYQEIFRVLKTGGRLFHYTGDPGGKYRGRDIQRGVMERLRVVGFSCRRDRENYGILAIKRSEF